MMDSKPVEFRGSALEDLRAFPEAARREAGYQLDQIQHGREPDDWKPMNTIGHGVREIRIRDAAGAFRVLYVAKFDDAIYVLHCFQKKTQKTSKADVSLAALALPRFDKGARSMSKKRFANVWDAIEDTPAQAENMKLRSALIMALKDHITRTGLSQSEAAKLLGVTQPRVSDLMRGKIELFGLDTLVNMIGAAGLHVEMRISNAA
jgi:phage-related protein/predicted XRE-type DNA-binding protein